MGATRTINVAADAAALDGYAADKGHFDVAFECSAAAPAIASAIQVLRPRGKLMQVGISGERPVPVSAMVGKEITIQGTQRFDSEFAQAVEMISGRRLDVGPLVTDTFPLAEAVRAFERASDRSAAVKVQIAFESA